MKGKLFLILCIVIYASRAFGQTDTVLTITIAKLTTDGVKMNLNGAPLSGKGDTVKAVNWKLDISGSFPKCRIKISSNSQVPAGFSDTVGLPANDGNYPISNGVLSTGTRKFLFKDGVHFQVLDQDGKLVWDFRNVVFSSQAKPDTAGGKSDAYRKTGVAYYDALYLADPQKNNGVKARILAFYAHKSDWDSVKQALKDNKFLSPLTERIGAIQHGGNIPSLPAFFSSLGGLDVTNLADGMAKFLVARTKQELAAAFFDNFRKAISDSNYKDLQVLFPATYMTLNAIGNEIYNYDAYIQTLRESFENDLRQLFVNLPKITDNSSYFSRHKDYAAILTSGCYIAEGLNEKQHPGQILRDYPADDLSGLNPNWEGAIQTLQLISESLRDTSAITDTTSYWVNQKQIATLLDDSTAFKIYLGLVYEQAAHWKDTSAITFGGGWTLCKILNLIAPPNFATCYSSYKAYFTNLITRTDKLTSMLAAYKKTLNDSVAVEQFYSYSMATLDFLEAASDVGKLAPLDSTFRSDASVANFFNHARESFALYFNVARSAVSVVWAVKRRSYASAIVNAASIYNLLVSNNYVKEMKSAKAFLDSTGTVKKSLECALKGAPNNDKLKKEYQQQKMAYDSASAYEKDLESSGGTMKRILEYGTFMATLVQAKNSDEVENAIETFALPAGSYRIKRQSTCNISLNSYVGPFIAYDAIKGLDKQFFWSVKSWRVNSGGLTAPIGVAFSTSNKSGCSYSLFVSLVDIGAVTAFRFTGDSTSQVPVIHLANIFSPGLSFSFGIPNFPLSVNIGAQMGPNLHRVSSEANDYSKAVYFRYGLSLVVDIPILDFYTEPRY